MHTLNIRILQFYLYAVMLMFIVGCKANGEPNNVASAATAAPQATPVDGDVIRKSDLKEQLEVTGTLVASQQVDIVSELTRKVVRVNVKEGSVVSTGELLFQLDDADLQAQLEKLHQQEKLAVLNEQRLNDLIKHEAVVQQDYDQAFTNLKVLQSQIAELQVMIAKTRIKAPFGGRIGIVHVYPGAVVSINTILTNLEDNSQVKVEFNVPEKYINTITPGTEQKFTVASDSKQYSARVVARESKIDPNTRTLLVRAVSANPGGVLVPGQSARLVLGLNSQPGALMVASQALIPTSQGYNVYISKNNTVQLKAIEIGQRSAYAAEVLKGLDAGDTVITSNLLRLMPGSPVKFVTVK